MLEIITRDNLSKVTLGLSMSYITTQTVFYFVNRCAKEIIVLTNYTKLPPTVEIAQSVITTAITTSIIYEGAIHILYLSNYSFNRFKELRISMFPYFACVGIINPAYIIHSKLPSTEELSIRDIGILFGSYTSSCYHIVDFMHEWINSTNDPELQIDEVPDEIAFNNPDNLNYLGHLTPREIARLNRLGINLTNSSFAWYSLKHLPSILCTTLISQDFLEYFFAPFLKDFKSPSIIVSIPIQIGITFFLAKKNIELTEIISRETLSIDRFKHVRTPFFTYSAIQLIQGIAFLLLFDRTTNYNSNAVLSNSIALLSTSMVSLIHFLFLFKNPFYEN